jgi:hypothetical protein
MHVDRNPATVVANGDRAIDMDRDINPGAEAGEMFVDRVIEDFENAVMQPALVGVADVHSGSFSDSFEAFELVDLGGVVFLILLDAGRVILGWASWHGFVVWEGQGGGWHKLGET